MVEAVVVDEAAQLVDVRIRLAGESDDERRAERDAGHAGANAGEQLVVFLTRPGPLHPLEHGIRRVLERQIDVFADLVALGHRRERLIVDRGGVEVEQPNPLQAVDRVELAQQPRERAALLPVDAVETSCPARSAAVP